MPFKDIAIFTFSGGKDEAAIAFAEALGCKRDAHLSAIMLHVQPNPAYSVDGVMIGPIWGDLLGQFEEVFAEERATLEARCKKSPCDIEIREITGFASIAAEIATVHARHADVSIMVRPRGHKMPDVRGLAFESALFGSGRPVFLVPPDWSSAQVGRRIVVAWDGKREAARAVADALPLLRRADQVFLVTVDAQPSPEGVGPVPGVDISTHLARHDVKVELHAIRTRDHEEGETLFNFARQMNADMIVMGGFGHARLSEMVFGGVTRWMVSHCPLPIFMSH